MLTPFNRIGSQVIETREFSALQITLERNLAAGKGNYPI